jgi:hypothetical protein
VITLSLVITLAVLGQADTSPFQGRWIADLAVSQVHKHISVRSIALTFVVEPARVRITDEVVSSAGEQIGQGSVEFIPDDQERPNDALLKGLVVRARWATPRRFETVFRRASGVTERVNYEVSPDGSTLTNTTDGPLGSQRIVFRRSTE